MGTRENAVRLALLQITVIVFAVLASAACVRLVETSVLPRVPAVTIFMTERGFLLLLLPLVWTWLMVRRRTREAAPNAGRLGLFFFGVLLLLALCLLAVESIV